MGDLSRVITSFVTMQAAPTPELVDALEAIVFSPSKLSPRVQAQAIREQAMLALGAVVRFADCMLYCALDGIC